MKKLLLGLTLVASGLNATTLQQKITTLNNSNLGKAYKAAVQNFNAHHPYAKKLKKFNNSIPVEDYRAAAKKFNTLKVVKTYQQKLQELNNSKLAKDYEAAVQKLSNSKAAKDYEKAWQKFNTQNKTEAKAYQQAFEKFIKTNSIAKQYMEKMQNLYQ